MSDENQFRTIACPRCWVELRFPISDSLQHCHCPECKTTFQLSANNKVLMNDSSSYLQNRKSPGLAILLSFFLCGTGQMYNGEVGKGFAMLLAYAACWATSGLVIPIFIGVGLWLWGMVDANAKAVEFNVALLNSIEKKVSEDMNNKHILATSISSQEFVSQINKYFKLFQSSLLSEAEFINKKKEIIAILTAKKILEAPEDFLTAVIPLIDNKALTAQEITQIKAAVL